MATWWKLTAARIPCRHEPVTRAVRRAHASTRTRSSQFARWYADAQVATDDKAAAMTIATATPRRAGPRRASCCCAGFDERGFVFYTNYDSRKAEELDANPHAAALFYWPQLDRQVRVEGPVDAGRGARSPRRTSRSGPRGHQVGAWASPQSTPIADRAFLQSLFDDAEARFADPSVEVPLPPFWGGYRLAPDGVRVLGEPRRPAPRPRPVPARRTTDWVIERLAP